MQSDFSTLPFSSLASEMRNAERNVLKPKAGQLFEIVLLTNLSYKQLTASRNLHLRWGRNMFQIKYFEYRGIIKINVF